MSRESDLLHALHGLDVFDDRRLLPPREMVAQDRELGAEVGLGSRPPTYRVWENGQALVVTAREQRLPRFAEATKASVSEGWPVVTRDSGGSAVPHGPGILQASLLLPQVALGHPNIEAVYHALCTPVRGALAGVGVETSYGDVPGSFCDGRFNLVSGSRKIAGTSQRWHGGLPPGGRPGAFVVAHLVLFVGTDTEAVTGVVNRFCQAAGSPDRFDPRAVVSVAGALSEDVDLGTLTEDVRRRIVRGAQALGDPPPASTDQTVIEGPTSG
jgi:lipoate-protein ligase A